MSKEIEWNIGDICLDVDSFELHFVINTKGLTKWFSNKGKWVEYHISDVELEDGNCFTHPQRIKLINILYGE